MNIKLGIKAAVVSGHAINSGFLARNHPSARFMNSVEIKTIALYF